MGRRRCSETTCSRANDSWSLATAPASTAEEIMAKYPGRRVDTLTVDIRVATALDEMIAEIWAGGPPDGLVNNAAGNFISQERRE